MRKIILILILLAIAAPAAKAYLPALGAGPGAPVSGSNNTAINASAQGSSTSSGTTCTATLTTTSANTLVFGYVLANSAGDISAGATFSGAGLTWTNDAVVANSPTNTQSDTMGHAAAASTFSSQVITATLPTTVTFCSLMVWAISGYNVGDPFDGAVVSGGGAPQSITTGNANDIIVAGEGDSSQAAPNYGACCSGIQHGNFQMSEYAIKTSTGTYSINVGASAVARAMIVRAVKSN